MSDLLIQLKSSRYYKKRGGLYSAQRVEVIKVFLGLDRQIDAESLWLHMINSGRKVSLSCVRSSLNWLLEYQMASKVKNERGIWTYCVFASAEPKQPQ